MSCGILTETKPGAQKKRKSVDRPFRQRGRGVLHHPGLFPLELKEGGDHRIPGKLLRG